MTEILFIRHAFTIANNAKWNNQEGLFEFIKEDENCPIENKYGKKQAEELNVFLKQYLKNKKIKCFLSPYYRVLQTASIALQNIFNVEYKIVDEIREINQGLFYARTKEELLNELKKHKLELLDYKIETNPYPLGESVLEVKERTKEFCNYLKLFAEQEEYDLIIVFSHATLNKAIYDSIMDEILSAEQKTTEVVSTKNGIIHSPKTLVPKGYIINLDEYNMEKSKQDKIKLMKYFNSTL